MFFAGGGPEQYSVPQTKIINVIPPSPPSGWETGDYIALGALLVSVVGLLWQIWGPQGSKPVDLAKKLKGAADAYSRRK